MKRLLVFLVACSHPAPPVEPPPQPPVPDAPPPRAAEPPLPQGAPDSPAGHQLAWVLDVLAHGGTVEDSAIEAHFAPAFLKEVPAAQLRSAFGQLAGHVGNPEILGVTAPDASHLVLRGRGQDGRFAIHLTVDTVEKIESLSVTPDTGEHPATMDEAAKKLEALAPRTQILVATLDGCSPLYQKNATDELALGSVFKLYVLLGLADQIAARKASWDEKLPVKEAEKSLPSGVTQDDPAGTLLPIRQLAERMISISDNTAADILLYKVGRKAVEKTVAATGHASPKLNVPFLGTREIFWLKMALSEEEVRRYLALAPEKRRAFLDKLAGKRPAVAGFDTWKKARYVDQIEWFASSADLCRLGAALVARKQPEVLDVLGKNPGLDADVRAAFSYVGFKGGSEPGVMNAFWLLRKGAIWYVVSVGANGPAEIDEGAFLGVAQGVVSLLAKEGR